MRPLTAGHNQCPAQVLLVRPDKGDKVVTRYKSTGTQQGAFNGPDSAGRKITIYEISIYRIANDKTAEQWYFPDALSLQNQLEAKK